MTAIDAPPVVEVRPGAIVSFDGEYEALSNFARTPFTLYGQDWPTGEHAFQGFKSTDRAEWRRVAAQATPGLAKKAGRSLPLRPDWDRIRKRVMLEVLLAKFTQNPDALAVLLGTGDAPLVEGNHWHDQFWGDCACSRPACAEPGRNYLGQLLMAVRLTLREDIR